MVNRDIKINLGALYFSPALFDVLLPSAQTYFFAFSNPSELAPPLQDVTWLFESHDLVDGRGAFWLASLSPRYLGRLWGLSRCGNLYSIKLVSNLGNGVILKSQNKEIKLQLQSENSRHKLRGSNKRWNIFCNLRWELN